MSKQEPDPVLEMAAGVTTAMAGVLDELKAMRENTPVVDPRTNLLVVPQWVAAAFLGLLITASLSFAVWINSNETDRREWQAGTAMLLNEIVERRFNNQSDRIEEVKDGLDEIKERLDRIEGNR